MFFSNEKECVLCQRQNYKMFSLLLWWPFWWSMPWSDIIFHWVLVVWRIRYSWWHLVKWKLCGLQLSFLNFLLLKNWLQCWHFVSYPRRISRFSLHWRFHLWSYVWCVRWWALLQRYFLRTQATISLRYGSRQQWWTSQWHFAGRFLVPVLLDDWFLEPSWRLWANRKHRQPTVRNPVNL